MKINYLVRLKKSAKIKVILISNYNINYFRFLEIHESAIQYFLVAKSKILETSIIRFFPKKDRKVSSILEQSS